MVAHLIGNQAVLARGYARSTRVSSASLVALGMGKPTRLESGHTARY